MRLCIVQSASVEESHSQESIGSRSFGRAAFAFGLTKEGFGGLERGCEFAAQ
jgi:hypothetical protein